MAKPKNKRAKLEKHMGTQEESSFKGQKGSSRKAKKIATPLNKQIMGAGTSAQKENKMEDSFQQKATDFVEANMSLQTAGFALAGAGLLALISTQAGRRLIKTAADSAISLVSSAARATAEVATSSQAPAKRSKKQNQNAEVEYAPA